MTVKSSLLALSAVGAVTMAVALFAQPKQANACPVEPYLSSICFMATTFCPVGYAAASGGTVPITDNQALYALIGNAYGGDGRTTFGYPDFRGRVPVGTGTGVALTEVQIGQMRGQETMTLNLQQMPRHNHLAEFTPSSGGTSGSAAKVQVTDAPGEAPNPTAGAYLGTSLGSNLYTTNPGSLYDLGGVSGGGDGSAPGGSVEVGYTGGNPIGGATDAFVLLNPQLGITACIAINGLFPQRS